MSGRLKPLTDYVVSLGIAALSHTRKTYLAHLIAVTRGLEAWGCDREVCDAGFFHSIYGTELFVRYALPLDRRGEVRALIGERAERLAYLNCAMDRASFDEAVERGTAPYRYRDRFTGGLLEVEPRDFDDLCVIHLVDWLEQVARSERWHVRPEAHLRLARRLGPRAEEAYQREYGDWLKSRTG